VLKSGAPDLLQALQFAQGITESLKQITDPLGYAIDLWKKEAQARLDMAAATGVSIDKVQQLNAALYKQIVDQANSGAIAGLDTFINSLQYGAGSAASPQNQYNSAFADYDAARQAALANPSAQTAAAFQQAAGAYLPLARQYYGTSETFGAIAEGAIGVAEQLKGFLAAPAMPDLAPVIQQTSAMSTAAIVESQAATTQEVASLREEVGRLNSWLGALASRLAPV
jgi:hypothetical protein